jgi:hypothetical protein
MASDLICQRRLFVIAKVYRECPTDLKLYF